ncbi:MAG TPA: N-acetyltransferase [Bacteroidales bacterium]|jgi:ribosomal protein S18 acetylase RimI-like enzyme|nr:N-acetyltransferase [Bacteroidales bacterium]
MSDLEKDFTIREYRKGDYPAVSALWMATGLSNIARGDSEEIIEETIRIGGKLLLLEQKSTSRIIGTSWLTYDGRRLHMHHFGIDPAFHGRGMAKLLLNHSLAFVKHKGCQVKLEVHETNEKAVSLYKKAGFKRLGDYDVYIIRDISTL